MGILERKERSKVDIKKKILEAAKELFIQRGFTETSVRNIAEKIEYSPTTIYLYYKDKNAIFHAIHDEGFGLLKDSLKILYNVHNPIERLKAIIRVYVNFALENKELYELMFILEAPLNSIEPSEENWEEGQKSFDILKSTVDECLEAGFFKGYTSENLSFILWSAVHGMCSLQIKGRSEKVFSVENAHRVLLEGIETLNKFLDQIKSIS